METEEEPEQIINKIMNELGYKGIEDLKVKRHYTDYNMFYRNFNKIELLALLCLWNCVWEDLKESMSKILA